MRDLDAIMADVRAAQDAELGDGADDLDAVAARLRVDREQPREAPKRVWTSWAAAAAVLLAVAGSAAALVRTLGSEEPSEPAPLSWRVDAPEAQTYEGWVATGEPAGRVSFSDGSRLALAGSTRLRVLEVRSDGATLVLEDGEVEARIHRRSQPSWRLHAGPFRIAVRGTTFTTRWDAHLGALSLAVTEGRVRLGGACLDRDRDVSAGERVELRCPLPGAPRPDVPPVETARARAEVEVVPVAPRRGRAAPPAAEPIVPPVASAEADAREALRIAQATAASGDAQGATARLQALRDAHPGSDEAALAAFLLGRLAFDEQRDAVAAATWLRAYLAERPAGALAREARGRLLEALEASGRSGEAHDEARTYLERYPGGPHAELARRLAGP